MTQQFKSMWHVARATLSILLVLNLHVWSTGCGGISPFDASGWIRINLGSTDLLKSTLLQSGFSQTTALEINPTTLQFRLMDSGPSRQVTGTYAIIAGEPVVSKIEFARNDVRVEFAFDGLKRITSISTSTGQRWTPDDPTAAPLFGPGLSGVDAYLGANQELVNEVRRMDSPLSTPGHPAGGTQSGGSSGGTGGGTQFTPNAKALDAALVDLGDLSGIFGVLAVVLGLQAAVFAWPVLYFVLQVVVAVNLLMGQSIGLPGSGGGGSNGGSTITGDATLRVINNLSGGVPIWYVVLVEDAETGQPGGNLLGEQAIPAGESRDFGVPPGTRDINLITPYAADCFRIYRRFDVPLSSGVVLQLSLADTDVGEISPADCAVP